MYLGERVRTIVLPRATEERPIYVANWPDPRGERELAEGPVRTDGGQRPVAKEEAACSASRR
jgi:hypothetical protein